MGWVWLGGLRVDVWTPGEGGSRQRHHPVPHVNIIIPLEVSLLKLVHLTPVPTRQTSLLVW